MNVTATELAPFITLAELRASLQEPELDDEQAAFLVELASATVRAEVAQTVNVIEDDTVVLNGTGSAVVLLPELEVRAVTLVKLWDAELSEGRDYRWAGAGDLRRLGWAVPYWPAVARCLAVTYSHGWAPPSPQWEAARTVALEVAGRAYRNPEMLQSERIGDYSRAYVPRGGRAELTPVEKRLLDPLRPGP